MSWASFVPWVPAIAATASGLVACGAALVRPKRPVLRRVGGGAVLACAIVAVAATVWASRFEQQADWERILPRLHEAVDRLAEIGEMLPASGPAAPVSFNGVDAGFAALANQSGDLKRRVAAYRKAAAARKIDDATAAAMIAYLRPLGPHRVVVSCVPNDVEAYKYANRIATILQRAGWRASGPEATTIFGTGPEMGISLYVRSDAPTETAHQLVAAFSRFNIKAASPRTTRSRTRRPSNCS